MSMRGLTSRKAVASAAVAALAMAGLAACGDDSSDTGATGGTLTVSLGQPQTLLPPNIQDVESAQPASVLYAGLVSYKQDGTTANDHAESIESDDNKVWTITIKPDWTFHNGDPVTAQSYVDAWNFGAYGPNLQLNSSYYSAIEGYEDVVAAEEGEEPAEETMSGLKVIDDTTFEVTLGTAQAQWPQTLGYQAFYPLAADCIDDPKACAREPIGNGPYEFVSWENDVELKVSKYADFKGTAGKVDAIDFKIYSDPNTSFNDALAGNLDLQRGIPAERIDEAQAQADRYVPVTLASTYQIGFPLYDEAYEDVRIRQAFALSFDRQQIIDKLLDPTYTPATGILPPNFPAFEADVCEFCKYDPEEAKRLIEEAEFEGPMEIFTNGDTPLLTAYQALANQASQSMGIEVVVKTVPTFEQFLTQRQEQTLTGPYRAAWVADWPTPDNYLKNLFYTADPGTSANDYGYSNADVDRLIDEAMADQDIDSANGKFQEAQRLILDDLPAVPVWWGGDQFFKGTNVENLQVTPFDIVLYSGISVA
jgi:ABC-type oligopeptide transport system substrate-binding subunit